MPKKLNDLALTQEQFSKLFEQRINLLSQDSQLELELKKEMSRFLSLEQVHKTLDQDNLWSFIVFLMKSLAAKL